MNYENLSETRRNVASSMEHQETIVSLMVSQPEVSGTGVALEMQRVEEQKPTP